MIKKTSIDRVVDTARIEEVVEDFVRLKRRGSGYQGLCPFHNEKTPSFTVNPAGNYYKCFGCGKGGSPVNFVMDHEKMTFVEAIRYLAQKYNIPIEETELTIEEKVEVERKDNILALMVYAQQYFAYQMAETDEGKAIAMPYFKERGILPQTLKEFGLGYAPKDRIRFTQQAIKDGYPLEMLKEAGLTSKAGNDFFYDRVMFTIQDHSGRPLAFAGRILGKSDTAPKYINSPETEIYKKSFVLYGLYQARQPMRKLDQCIVVEGYMDVISLHQAGIENVVASSGTALTEGQLQRIKRFTPNILLLYDGDNAGINAALRAIDLAHEQDMQVMTALLPDQHDPDSFVRDKGAEGFRTYLETNALDFLRFHKLIADKQGKNDPISKTKVIKEVVQSIAKIQDGIKRNLYLREASAVFQIEERTLAAELNGVLKKEIFRQNRSQKEPAVDESQWISTPVGPSQESQHSTVQNHFFQERDVLRILISYGHLELLEFDEQGDVLLSDFILENIEDVIEAIENDSIKKLFNIAYSARKGNRKIDQKLFTSHPDPQVQAFALDVIATPHEYSPNWINRWGLGLQTQLTPEKNILKDATQAIFRLKLKKIRADMTKTISEIAAAEAEGDLKAVDIALRVYLKQKQIDQDLSEKLNNIYTP
jgi:DNA primase